MTRVTPIVPMPSRFGTNHEDMWVPLNWREKNKYFAFDEAPPGFSRNGKRPPARDQEPDPDISGQQQLDPTQAAAAIVQILQNVSDPGSVMATVQRELDGGGVGNGNGGSDAETEFKVRPGYIPAASGRTAPGALQKDKSAGLTRTPKSGFDSGLSMDKADPTLFAHISRIRLAGR
jgi:hypothetical protein